MIMKACLATALAFALASVALADAESNYASKNNSASVPNGAAHENAGQSNSERGGTGANSGMGASGSVGPSSLPPAEASMEKNF